MKKTPTALNIIIENSVAKKKLFNKFFSYCLLNIILKKANPLYYPYFKFFKVFRKEKWQSVDFSNIYDLLRSKKSTLYGEISLKIKLSYSGKILLYYIFGFGHFCSSISFHKIKNQFYYFQN